MIIRAMTRFPPAPITAPTPNGAALPRTKIPVLDPYLVTKFRPSTLLIARIVESGTEFANVFPQ
jgi:hypothetical protein